MDKCVRLRRALANQSLAQLRQNSQPKSHATRPIKQGETHDRDSAALSLLPDGCANGRKGRDVFGRRWSCESSHWSAGLVGGGGAVDGLEGGVRGDIGRTGSTVQIGDTELVGGTAFGGGWEAGAEG